MQTILTVIIAMGMLLGSVVMAQPATPEPAEYAAEELLAIKPELREQVAASLPAGMTEYEIRVDFPELDPTSEIVATGWQRVTVTNTTGDALDALPFRLYANGAAVERNPLEITSLTVSGETSEWEMSVDDSVATIPLADVLDPGEHLTLEMEFTLTVPVDNPAFYGMLNLSTSNGTTALAHWYPVLAGRDPVTGWMLKPTSIYGDPVFTDAGLYDVTISAPASQKLITSGVEIDREENGDRQTVTFNAKPSRDFVIFLSETLESTSTEVDGTTIYSWALPNHQEGGNAVLGWTANTLEVFNPLLGEYPWVQVQAVEAVVFAAAAVELPQMFIMGTDFYTSPDLNRSLSYFEFTTAHEAVHMWFYSLVGNNQYDDAFIDEGLTNYLSGAIYFREVYGDSAGEAAFTTFLYRPFKRLIEANADVIVDFPTDNFPSSSAYNSAVYTKAPVGFNALHIAMGDDAFFTGLANYVAEFSFRVATPADLEAALQEQTDIDVREIWSHWFERREGALDINGVQPPWVA